MNPKVIGILLLVVGLGIGLYFINSGGGAKLADIIKTPGSTTSTISAPATSSAVVASASSSNSGVQASSSGFTWASFFASLFPTHSFVNIPLLSGSGGDAYNSGS